MKRTKEGIMKRLPDLIYLNIQESFTPIKNELIRNPHISHKARGLLTVLLSNKSGEWTSYMKYLQNNSMEGKTSIRNGIKELEDAGYLKRYYFGCPDTKRRHGIFWAITDTPGCFEFAQNAYQEILQNQGFEIMGGVEICKTQKPKKPPTENPNLGNTKIGKNGSDYIDSDNVPYKNTNRIRNTKEEEEREMIKSCPYEQIKNLYNETCVKLPTVRMLSSSRKKTIQARWKQYKYDINEFKVLFNKASQSSFLTGHNDRNWIADFDWLLKDTNMAKTLEGKYDDKQIAAAPDKSESSHPRKIIRAHFKNKDLSEIFYESCYIPAEELFNDKFPKNKLTEQLIAFYVQIDQTQLEKLPQNLWGILPGPADLVASYIAWIEDNEWITNVTLKMLDITHNLFGKFRRDEARKDNMERDPLTGLSYMRG